MTPISPSSSRVQNAWRADLEAERRADQKELERVLREGTRNQAIEDRWARVESDVLSEGFSGAAASALTSREPERWELELDRMEREEDRERYDLEGRA